MRKLWIRLVLWWNGVCSEHGDTNPCTGCNKDYQNYLDRLLKELNP